MVCVLGVVLVPSAAVAQDFSAGGPLWYVDAMKIQAIHDAGITGEGVTIAVLDAGISPDVATLRGADIEVRQLAQCPDPVASVPTAFEASSHGTSVTSLIVGNGSSDSGSGPVGIAPGARILYYGALQASCDGNAFPAAVADAIAEGADIVSMSGGNTRLADELSQPAADAVAEALRGGVLVVAGLPNADSVWEGELGEVNGVVNVASVDAMAHAATRRDGSPMTNDDVDIVAPGVDLAGLGWDRTWGMSTWSGNSAATPIVAGLLALAKEKWPDATASQLLQSLIRNTGSTPHELEWTRTFGHGIANATRLVQEDPAQYPDENPLFTDGQSPTFDEVYSAPERSASEAPNAQANAGPGVLPWALAGGGAVVVVVAVTLILVIRRRRGRGVATGSRDMLG
ncbi:S8 family peptidase [Microbacterium phyllosphaerae]|uniref:S8 family peptidase n=1 Tax=Microbacterium phyllosphaerae TaxID=124798 RepID=UPI00216A6AA1|nr:S8/S53 family peptidase [Microbacterium phyllosphaerae]MCS3442053.1 subtilisin family serine protease [Microbacterium phyllosphaerae]